MGEGETEETGGGHGSRERKKTQTTPGEVIARVNMILSLEAPATSGARGIRLNM